jgi:hypothetical protein
MMIPGFLLRALFGLAVDVLLAILARIREKDLLNHALAFAESHAKALDEQYGIDVDAGIKAEKKAKLTAFITADLAQLGYEVADGLIEWVAVSVVQKLRRQQGRSGVRAAGAPATP